MQTAEATPLHRMKWHQAREQTQRDKNLISWMRDQTDGTMEGKGMRRNKQRDGHWADFTQWRIWDKEFVKFVSWVSSETVSESWEEVSRGLIITSNHIKRRRVRGGWRRGANLPLYTHWAHLRPSPSRSSCHCSLRLPGLSLHSAAGAVEAATTTGSSEAEDPDTTEAH